MFKATNAAGTSDFRGLSIPVTTAGLVVWISRTRPSWNERERRWEFPAHSPSVISADVSDVPRNGEYVAQPYQKLENGELYYYLITVNGGDRTAPPGQRTGSFRAEVRTTLGDVFKP